MVFGPDDPPPEELDALTVGLSPRLNTWEPSMDTCGRRSMDVLAGRTVTRSHLFGGLRPGDHQVLIYGEPYGLLVQLAAGELAIDALRGQAVLGPPLDLAAYIAPSGGRLLTSLGCGKACAYCAFGATYRRLYGRKYGRRERPWPVLAAEIADRVARGEGALAFMADQFLAVDPDENEQLAGLVANMDLPYGVRPVATFTVAPHEVLANRPLIEGLNRVFDARPRLSVDSLDDEALACYQVGFDAAEALMAAACLTELNVPFRLNYIFARPSMTVEALQREFTNLHALARMTRDRPPAEQWLLANDVFTSRLTPMLGAPLWIDGDVAGAADTNPPEMLSRLMDRIVGVLCCEVDGAGLDTPAAPFLAAVEAGLDVLFRN